VPTPLRCPHCDVLLPLEGSRTGEEFLCPVCRRSITNLTQPAQSVPSPPPLEESQPWWITAPTLPPESAPASSPPSPEAPAPATTSLPAPSTDVPWWVAASALPATDSGTVKTPVLPEAVVPLPTVNDSTHRTSLLLDSGEITAPPLPPVHHLSPSAPLSSGSAAPLSEGFSPPPPVPAVAAHDAGVTLPAIGPGVQKDIPFCLPETPVVEADEEPPASFVDRMRNLDLGTAAAFCCGCVALFLDSLPALRFLSKPLAGLGLAIGLLACAASLLGRRTSVVFPIVASVLCLIPLLFVEGEPGSVPQQPTPSLVAVPAQNGDMPPTQPIKEDDWVDASVSAVQRQGLRVQVIAVWAGKVELTKQGQRGFSPDKYLAIRLFVSIRGLGSGPIPYESWADSAGQPSKHQPTLLDNLNRTYEQKTIAPPWKLAGRADKDLLTIGHQVKDVLIFPVPSGNVEYLRLTLPASAFGRSGEFRFQIPRKMIQVY
jgi:hypothetical protein